MVVDGHVQEVPTATAVAPLVLPAAEPPASAIAQSPELLDVDVDQVAGVQVLVADCGRSRCPIEVTQLALAIACEHRIDRGTCQPGMPRDGQRSLSQPAPTPDPADVSGAHALADAHRAAGSVAQASITVLGEPGKPLVRGLPRDARSQRCSGHTPVELCHADAQQS